MSFLELESAFAGGVGQGLDFAMVFEPASIEDDLRDFLSGATLGDQLAYLGGDGHIGAGVGFGTDLGLGRVNRNESLTDRVINDLSSDVAAGEMDSQARAGGRAGKLLAKTSVAEFAFVGGGHGLLDGFAFLAAELFAGETHTFAFVGLWRVEGSDVCGTLTNHLVVNALDTELGVFRDGDFYTFGDIEKDRMGLSEAKVKDFALDSGLETDAVDFHVTLEAVRDTNNHVSKKSAGETMECLVLAVVASAIDSKLLAFDFCGDRGGKFPLEFSLRAFDKDGAVGANGHFDLRRDSDGFFTDS